jgi:SAM-dependent methyltransferase
MLQVARRRWPGAVLLLADLNRPLPVAPGFFDAVLCTLVAEHLSDLQGFFEEALTALAPGGRMVLSVFHPDMVAAGMEAHFEHDGTEYRLGAEGHATGDYLHQVEEAGFREIRWREHGGDAELVEETPSAEKYLDRRLLLTIEASRPSTGQNST